jgi:hypothetical protein
LLVESLVWAHVVILMSEMVEHTLLGIDVNLWRPCGLDLECKMHTLVSAILFRVSGSNALRTYTKFDPPDGQSREACKAIGREGRSIVRPYDLG